MNHNMPYSCHSNRAYITRFIVACISLLACTCLLTKPALAERVTLRVHNCTGYEIVAFRAGAGAAYHHFVKPGSTHLKCKTRKYKGIRYCRMQAYYSDISQKDNHHRKTGYMRDVDIKKAEQYGGVCVKEEVRGGEPVPVFKHYCSGC